MKKLIKDRWSTKAWLSITKFYIQFSSSFPHWDLNYYWYNFSNCSQSSDTWELVKFDQHALCLYWKWLICFYISYILNKYTSLFISSTIYKADTEDSFRGAMETKIGHTWDIFSNRRGGICPIPNPFSLWYIKIRIASHFLKLRYI